MSGGVTFLQGLWERIHLVLLQLSVVAGCPWLVATSLQFLSVITSPSLLSVKSPSAFLTRMLRDLQHIGLIQDHLPIPRALTFNHICKDSFFFPPKYRTIYRFQGLESDILKGPLLGLTTVISLD